MDILNGFPSKSLLNPPSFSIFTNEWTDELGGMSSLVQQTRVRERPAALPGAGLQARAAPGCRRGRSVLVAELDGAASLAQCSVEKAVKNIAS